MRAKIIDQTLLVAACLGVAISAIWAWRAEAKLRPSIVPEFVLTATEFRGAAVPEISNLKSIAWTAPPSQSRGAEWIYDVFSAPDIYFDARAKAFSVDPPAVTADEPRAQDFGLELLRVHAEPYVLQLVGFVGKEGSYRGIFENGLTREHFLGKAGTSVSVLALTIVDFKVKRVRVKTPESMTTQQLVATAVARDERSGVETILTSRERVYTGAAVACVAFTTQADEPREVREGEVLENAGTRFRIEAVHLSPPSIEVAKQGPGASEPELRTLRLRD